MAFWSSSQGSPCEGQVPKGGSDPGEEEQNSGVGTSGSEPENPYSQPLAGNKGGQGEGQERKRGGGTGGFRAGSPLAWQTAALGPGRTKGEAPAPAPGLSAALGDGALGCRAVEDRPPIEPPQRGSLRSMVCSCLPPLSLSSRHLLSRSPGSFPASLLSPLPASLSPSIPPSSPALSPLPAFPRQISLSLHVFLQLPTVLCPQTPSARSPASLGPAEPGGGSSPDWVKPPPCGGTLSPDWAGKPAQLGTLQGPD